jgi:hypothetical protein
MKSKKSWRSLLGALMALNIVKNGLEMRKLWPFKVCMVKKSKKCHPTLGNHSENTQTVLVCCSIAFRVQR